MSSNIQKNLYDAIKLMIEDYMKKASFDQTIIAHIVKKKDEAGALYSIYYQGGYFNAYAIPGITYSEGTQVYVLKPQNDFDKNLFILGAVNGDSKVDIINDDIQDTKHTWSSEKINNMLGSGNAKIVDKPNFSSFPPAGEENCFYLALDTDVLYLYRHEKYIVVGSGGMLDPDVIESKL